ncbi:hypothetical protein BDA96_02G433400 [Sorghum bicolor]|uniref:Uncharacterized protein n=2 Tax=Sorghum bicolor TaxID=4558 RepID=A0A921RV46_SORBI|nr:uncharacterized protein LOC8074429 [Sorghum bicolor]EER97711.1 hypothetical protein SORBI_3002G413300 [Sorghum bicolor]KAG0546274.1 hypothetical protein BDA96_02G433400 [Sorghum bicolor]|eukprot:XP_002461190.1 uncharacterized protein LOC8074429 [Sorghum bicolor]
MLRLRFRPAHLSLKLAFTLSLAVSFSVSCCASSSSSSPRTSASSPEGVAADLLSVLGGPRAAARVPAAEASRLRACLRFLAPANPTTAPKVSSWSRGGPRKFLLERCDAGTAEADEMVMWPPAPVLELARLAVDSGGDPGAIHRALDPTMLPVPDVEAAQKNKCELTRTPYGRRFANEEINSYFAFLFELIVARGPSVGLNVSLNRYDLFHGHLFLASGTGRLGILFHAKEYPAFNKELFPYYLGYCQAESSVPYDDSMNLRNVLWLAPLPSNETKAWLAPGALVVLDAHPDGIIYQEMIRDYVQIVRTIYEDDLGEVAVDVNYLNVANAAPIDRVFIC